MKSLLIAALALVFSAGAYAQKNQFNSTGGVAIKGYDPVAYFTQHKAVEGNGSFIYDWSGSTWKFSSQASLDSFKAAPEKYAPQYGGYCAYGCSRGYKAPTDPNAWTIVDNKLYLNYNLKVKEIWSGDMANLITIADSNWITLNK